MMAFNELSELPGWLKTTITLLLGAGGAKLLAVWLENRRLEKKEYRDTLLGRIRELETTIQAMQASFTNMSVKLALVEDENSELRDRLGMPRKSDVHAGVPRQSGGSDAQPPQSV
jgi:hypothetical protein